MKVNKILFYLVVICVASADLFGQYQPNKSGISGEERSLLHANNGENWEPSTLINRDIDERKKTNNTKAFASDSLSYFADNGFGKPVSTMQHPAGEYNNGVTYLAYQGPHEDPYVCSYNHKTKEWTGPIKAGTSALGKTPPPTDRDKIDNHGRPALFVDGEGYIHLVFGGHGGLPSLGTNSLGFNGRGQQTHVVSKKPGDISSWEILDNISQFGTYSQFIKMTNGSIYLFYRHGSHRSDWVYQKSTDNGRTFEAPVSILQHKPQEGHPSVYDSWYAWFQEGPDNTIISSFNYHPCGNPGHSSLRVNAYAMKMNGHDDTWRNINRTKLVMPLTKESADSMTLVFDSKGQGTRLGTTIMDSEGNPQQYFRYASKKNQSILYYRWTGVDWKSSGIIDPKYKFSDGDMIIEYGQNIQFLLSQRYDDFEEVGWWVSNDNGINWEKENSLIKSANSRFVMSALLRNAHPDARVIVAEIPNDPLNLSSKLYLLGDSGPVIRNQKQKVR